MKKTQSIIFIQLVTHNQSIIIILKTFYSIIHEHFFFTVMVSKEPFPEPPLSKLVRLRLLLLFIIIGVFS